MPELKVGLAPNRTSYYDKITNTYITLQNPVQVIKYTDYKELERITHAVFASKPALVIYEGEIPKEAVEAWKMKYMKPFRTDVSKLVRTLTGDLVAPTPNRAFDRTEKLNGKPAEKPEKPEEPEEIPGSGGEETEGDVSVQSLKGIEAKEAPVETEEKPKEEKKITRSKAKTKKTDADK